MTRDEKECPSSRRKWRRFGTKRRLDGREVQLTVRTVVYSGRNVVSPERNVRLTEENIVYSRNNVRFAARNVRLTERNIVYSGRNVVSPERNVRLTEENIVYSRSNVGSTARSVRLTERNVANSARKAAGMGRKVLRMRKNDCSPDRNVVTTTPNVSTSEREADTTECDIVAKQKNIVTGLIGVRSPWKRCLTGAGASPANEGALASLATDPIGGTPKPIRLPQARSLLMAASTTKITKHSGARPAATQASTNYSPVGCTSNVNPSPGVWLNFADNAAQSTPLHAQ
eukprot:TRINITY_DN5836_c0_g1_i1.p1 TRINITY_DN5836_c0_g1~~TRINITY_DN5836_c0_g1_i1.p1  ORF type:complete len:286 (+),score=6.10 TRINITY_DN5836_c0_g1_i1:186-1043(+)